jgi:DUF177 domain-containing protein
MDGFVRKHPADQFDAVFIVPEGAGDLTRLDPRAPLVVDTRDLPRRPGSMRTVTRTVPAPADLRGELLGVLPGSDLVLDLRLESVSEGVLVSGTTRVTLTGECARCLDPLTCELEVDVQQLYVYPGNEIDADDEDDEIGQLIDDCVDLEPALRDAVVLALPLAPVCREDCQGLCPDCGVRLEDVEPGHRHDRVDPRWAALGSIGTTEEGRTAHQRGGATAQSTTDDQES